MTTAVNTVSGNSIEFSHPRFDFFLVLKLILCLFWFWDDIFLLLGFNDDLLVLLKLFKDQSNYCFLFCDWLVYGECMNLIIEILRRQFVYYHWVHCRYFFFGGFTGDLLSLINDDLWLCSRKLVFFGMCYIVMLNNTVDLLCVSCYKIFGFCLFV